MKGILFSIALIFIAAASAQEIVAPLDTDLFLSGNFGELRSNHFHSGIDFKTKGITGLPVRAVKGGYVSRISISAGGYGKAIYIGHPDGTTSVYGHLEGFIPAIEHAVRDSQYRYESFAVNLFFRQGEFAVRQGEVFAYSGNSGSSGGPHLHFELRGKQSERPFDPLPLFGDRIRDSIPPEILGVILLPQPGKGVAGSDMTAWGRIGIAVKAYDRMNGTNNIYGVKEIILRLEGRIIFHYRIDDFSFGDTRYVNSFIDYGRWVEDRELYMKSFVEKGNHFDAFLSDDGIVMIDEERDYRFEYTLMDSFGNTAVKNFTVRGKRQDIPAVDGDCITFLCDRDNHVRASGLELSVPRGSLYTDLCLKVTRTGGQFSAPVYSLGVKAPLHSACNLSLDIWDDSFTGKSKYGIVAINRNDMNWLGGQYGGSRITAGILELGDFTVAVDTIPPKITKVKPKTGSNRITFHVTDNLSGIESYRATVDGKFLLLEYDAKTGTMSGMPDLGRIKSDVKAIRLEVADRAGNATVREFFFKP
ncbi:MAG: M23 family metallopeptidase [Dysgonamonadaceae bacterium]|jgi:hypothetical protein|nr:M23 family metallopeptidase [Dysgonamonadaceae bacterium]